MPKKNYAKLKKWYTTKTKVPVIQTHQAAISVHECFYRTAAKGKLQRGNAIIKNGQVFGVISEKLHPVSPKEIKTLAFIAIG